VIRPLRESDEPSGFSCGVRELDEYLRRHALMNSVAGASVTYVLEDVEVGIAGYVTLAAASVRTADLGPNAAVADDLPAYPLPALLVARLAVDRRRAKQGIGSVLLAYALEEALIARDRIGCVAVLVDAKPGAIGFYERHGFAAVSSAHAGGADACRMLLGMGTLTDALRRS